MRQVTCQECSAAIDVEDDFTSAQIDCPQCQRSVPVPIAVTVVRIPATAAAPTVLPPPAVEAPEIDPSARRRWWLWTAAAIALGALTTLAVLATRPDPPWARWLLAPLNMAHSGDADIGIKGITIEHPMNSETLRYGRGREPVLVIHVWIRNTGKSTLHYARWAPPLGVSYGTKNLPQLKDDQGNEVMMVYPAGLADLSADPHYYQLGPSEEMEEVLFFEVPKRFCPYLRLRLPAQNLHGAGVLRFEIPADMIPADTTS